MCLKTHLSVLISFVQISLNKSSRNEWFRAADSSWSFCHCCLAIALFPGSSESLRSPQEKMFGLTDSSSEKCAWCKKAASQTYCAQSTLENCNDIKNPKTKTQQKQQQPKNPTKKNPMPPSLQTPLFQSIINTGAAVTFPPVALKCSGFQLQIPNVSAGLRGRRAGCCWAWGCRIQSAVGRSAGERLTGAWRLICLT